MEADYTIYDFSGYNENCSQIKAIIEWADNKSFTYSDLKLHFPFVDYSRFVKYLVVNKKERFFEDFLKTAYYEDLQEAKQLIAELKTELKSAKISSDRAEKEKDRLRLFESKENLTNELIFLQDWKQKQLDKSKVIDVLEYFFNQSFKPQSYRTTNSIMYRVLTALIEVADFKINDFLEITKKFNFGYWGGNCIESFYASSIISNNNSAWKSIEFYLKRTPFIINGKRCYESFSFTDKNSRVLYRCTGFNEAGNIKFVYDENGKQKRLSFTNKAFKDFAKPLRLMAA